MDNDFRNIKDIRVKFLWWFILDFNLGITFFSGDANLAFFWAILKAEKSIRGFTSLWGVRAWKTCCLFWISFLSIINSILKSPKISDIATNRFFSPQWIAELVTYIFVIAC